MSVFSKLKFAKKAASDKKAVDQRNAALDTTPPRAPYKHTPTHAAYDALSGAPSSWKQDDRPLIKEQHKRRSQMAGAGSRTASYMSSAAHPTATAPDALPPKLNRLSSYSSYNPTWNDRGDRAYLEQPATTRHSRLSRSTSYIEAPTPQFSTFTSQNASPLLSSANSATSDSSVHLDPKPSVGPSSSSGGSAGKPAAATFQEKDIFHRLHTSTNRKLGEAPVGEAFVPQLSVAPAAPSRQVTTQEPQRERAAKRVRLGFGFHRGKGGREGVAAA